MITLADAIIRLGEAQTQLNNSERALNILRAELRAEERQRDIHEITFEYRRDEILFLSLVQAANNNGLEVDEEAARKFKQQTLFFERRMAQIEEADSLIQKRRSEDEPVITLHDIKVSGPVLSHEDITSRVRSAGIGQGKLR